VNGINICKAEGLLINIPFMFNIGETMKQVKEYLIFIDKNPFIAISSPTLRILRRTKLYENPYIPNNTKLRKCFIKELKKRWFQQRFSRILWILTNPKALRSLILVVKTKNFNCFKTYFKLLLIN